MDPSRSSLASARPSATDLRDVARATQRPSPSPRRGLTKVMSNLEQSTDNTLALPASPCFFHRRFGEAVDVDKVLEEIAADDGMSHSKLVQTATGVREVSRQLQRRPIKRAVRTVMIVTKARDNSLVTLTRELSEWLIRTPRYGSTTGVTVYVDQKLRRSSRFNASSLTQADPRFEQMLQYWTPDLCWSSPERFDLVLTLGGDGTVLFTSWLFQRVVPPVLSFSLGSLGFLTSFDFVNYQSQLDSVMGGLSSGRTTPQSVQSFGNPQDVVSDAGMKVNLRMRFTCTVYRASRSDRRDSSVSAEESSQFEVLNELVIDRGPSPYVSNLELFGDDQLLTVIQADGVIFSTPTGSTAYSLSAGGSLVHPDIPAILLTPICPHTLSFRPMLLNDTMALRVAVPRNSRATAYCSFDGKGRIELRQGDFVTIAASRYPFPTVVGRNMEWIDSVSRTLRWNTRQARQKGWSASASTRSSPHLSTAEQQRDAGSAATADALTKGLRAMALRDGETILPKASMMNEEDTDDDNDNDEHDSADGDAQPEAYDIDISDDEGADSRDSGYGGDGASTASGPPTGGYASPRRDVRH